MKQIVIKVGDHFPKSCDECAFFSCAFGRQAYCVAGGKYTREEIEADEGGFASLVYVGCLSNRPNNCPLTEVEVET